MARVPLLQKDQAHPIMQEFYQKSEDAGHTVLNLFKAAAHSPKIGRDLIRLGSAILFKGDLSPILRELAILRIGHVNKAHYEWTQHVRIGLAVGVPQEKIDAVPEWESSDIFDETERAVLAYTDEVNRNIKASDGAFSKIQSLLGDKETVELTITIGYYGMISRILESLNIELE